MKQLLKNLVIAAALILAFIGLINIVKYYQKSTHDNWADEQQKKMIAAVEKEKEDTQKNNYDTRYFWSSYYSAQLIIASTLESNLHVKAQVRLDGAPDGSKIIQSEFQTETIRDSEEASWLAANSLNEAVKIARSSSDPVRITGIILTFSSKNHKFSVIDQDNDGMFDYVVKEIPVIFWPEGSHKGWLTDQDGNVIFSHEDKVYSVEWVDLSFSRMVKSIEAEEKSNQRNQN